MRHPDSPARAATSAALVQPLFTHDARRWLRLWAVAQGAALTVATWIAASGAGARRHPAPLASWLVPVVAALVLYHVAAVRGYDWLLRRRWRVLVFVPIGWALVLAALDVDGAFGLLLLGAIMQGFVFLPYTWAVTLLAVVTAALAALVGAQGPAGAPGVTLARVASILATGVMISTVLLYIHHVNREAVLRARLLRQLDEAQRDLAERAREAGVRDERQRFARDIHDTLAQGFASVIKHLEASELSLGTAAGSADEARVRVLHHLAHAKTVSQESLGEIRRLVWALRPVALTEAPLAQALARVVAQWGEANAVRTTFSCDALPALQPDADVLFLRATQEALSNVARHAHAANVAVSIGCIDGLVLLTVEDDGRGFAQPDAAGAERHGLTGMRERVRTCGGHLIVDSAAGKGTSLTVAVPLSSIAAAHTDGVGA